MCKNCQALLTNFCCTGDSLDHWWNAIIRIYSNIIALQCSKMQRKLNCFYQEWWSGEQKRIGFWKLQTRIIELWFTSTLMGVFA
jgi:hypothetical protein